MKWNFELTEFELTVPDLYFVLLECPKTSNINSPDVILAQW